MEINEPKDALELVMRAVCDVMKCDAAEVLSRSREHDIVYRRHVAMYCMYFPHKRYPGFGIKRGLCVSPFGSSAIGKLFKWDHATVFHADKKVRNAIQTYKHDRDTVLEIVTRLAQENFHYPIEKFLDDVEKWSRPDKFV